MIAWLTHPGVIAGTLLGIWIITQTALGWRRPGGRP